MGFSVKIGLETTRLAAVAKEHSQHGMQLTTILNRVEKFKSFVYGKTKWIEDADRPTIEVHIEARKNGRPICSGCDQPRPGYDRQPERRFEYVPMWGIAVFFVYAMRRVNCPKCGVKVEKVPWCDGKNQLTTTYRWFLAGWAKRISWSEVACAFGTSWQNVFRSVKHAVSWGFEHRDLEDIESIGVDELGWVAISRAIEKNTDFVGTDCRVADVGEVWDLGTATDP